MPKWLQYIKAKPINFLTVLLLERTASTYYQTIAIKDSKIKNNETQGKTTEAILTNACWMVFDVPNYLETTPYSNTKSITLNTFTGTSINLKNYKNFKDYMECKFSAKRRAQFRTFEKRLNQSFNISYKTIYGNTTPQEFNTLFNQLYKMLETRFVEKQMVNDEIPYWEYYREKIYPLIQNKEAFLSVIYADETPISISINMISGKAVYGYLKSYDTNFSKFSIGFLDLIKVTQWAFENNLEVFDFLKGHYDYKSKWTDTEYHFQKQIVYNPKSAVATTVAWYNAFKIKGFYAMVSVLKTLQVHKLLKKGIQWKYNLTHRNNNNHNKQFTVLETLPITYLENYNALKLIDINQQPFTFLKKPVCDFLFNQQDHIANIKVFTNDEKQQTFAITGTKNFQIISHA
ncbi:hypothetical protein CJ739_3391 [Mariniflexile rhizosphaerae]|uniref:GNAT family N-acetyltransferase n=1 Tax=unclassified Mariniflexile TaxID=2643887 RepID=UPI000CB215E9|nr:GNAT family N-acetyltransferase [Mariniflexile sp. TRM1-10]AXP82453.1 hypothetical protein CJ739_3391 [Mariniflexile sp. TRM1-10]PLB18395.1 MAG: Acetyltransf_6 domain containing protein [Flavobacteriaceae bacterium FS1-H7996/R]